MAKTLLEQIVTDFPKQFFTHLAERQMTIYQHSIDKAFGDEAWARAEAFFMLPQFRRALWESATRDAAVAASLRCFDIEHNAQNSSCLLVKSGQCIMTAHYVEGPNEKVREAESRKQNAGVNEWMNEYTDDRLLTSPLPKIEKNTIYVNLLHGADFPGIRCEGKPVVDAASCFLRVAIPDAESGKYRFNRSVQEVLQAYSAVTETAVEDKAHPQRKAQPQPKRAKGKASGAAE